MKRIRVILTRMGELEILTIKGPLFVAVCADRFVIDDQRGPIKAAAAEKDPSRKMGKPS